MANISRNDIRNTLHTYFHSQATKQSKQAPLINKTSLAIGRKKVYSFVQVQKTKSAQSSKRIFGGSNSSLSKSYILCVCVQEATTTQDTNVFAQLHYLQYLSNFTVDVRESWDIGKLDVIENNGLSSEKKRGSFGLTFEGDDITWEWLVDDTECKFAMQEFIWSLAALCVERKKMLPKMVRFNIEELNEIAIHLNLQKKYGIDIDLLDHMSSIKNKTQGSSDNPLGNGSQDADNLFMSAADKKAGSLILSATENEDAGALLASVNWSACKLQDIEEDLKKKLKVLEDENMTFLLSFESDNQKSNAVSKPQGIPAGSAGGNNNSIEKIINSIDAVLKRVKKIQDWTNESDEFLEKTSMNMNHFESLNNQLEVHFKNTVALQEKLEQMMKKIEIPREQMGILLKPLVIFPDDNDSENKSTYDFGPHIKSLIDTIDLLDTAIKSADVYPANEMAAFRARGEELQKLSKSFCEKICSSFDLFMQRKVKQWLQESAQQKARLTHSPSMPKPTSPPIPVWSAAQANDRISRANTTFEGDAVVDWTLNNEGFHVSLEEYQPLFAHLHSLDARVTLILRHIYVKSTSQLYSPHFQSVFRCLKEKLPKMSKAHFTSLQSWSFHLSSAQLSEALGASALLQQGLDHVIPLCVREQQFLSRMFFPKVTDHQGNVSTNEPEELTLMMENVCEKLLKRMIDFGEAAATRNILDALSLVVLVNGMLQSVQSQSEFLFNVLVSFQLQMKRLLMKFAEDQESWINAKNPDTRMAGVLSAISKTMNIVHRLEESVFGKADDSTLASIYHRIIPCTMQWLEKVSDSKPKYKSLLLLENYYFMSEKMTACNSTEDLPLAEYTAQAHAKYTENAKLYVEWIFESEFKEITPVFASIEALLKTLPTAEIQFHVPQQNVGKAIEAITFTVEKSIKAMYDRIKKHVSNNLKMLPIIWKVLEVYITEKIFFYEKIATECYQLRLDPTPHSVQELVAKFE